MLLPPKSSIFLHPARLTINAVVASCAVFVPIAAVGAVGVPVNAGDASGAYGASRLVKPTPLTVPLAERFVNAPVLGVVEPIAPGAANVAPFSVAALIVVLHPKLPPVHVTAFVVALHVTSPVELKVPLTRRLW